MSAADGVPEANPDPVEGVVRRVSRRGFIAGAGASAMAGVAYAQETDQATPASDAAAEPQGERGFGFENVIDLARERARGDFSAPTMQLRPPFSDLSYDQYRAIRFREDARPITGAEGAFALDLLPPGLVYRHRVNIFIVRDGQPQRLQFAQSMFDFDPQHFQFPDGKPPTDGGDGLDFSGFRLRHPINSPDVMDEFVVFQGASYFRAIARSMIYGVSARGLAIATADPRGEEFPVFTSFWIAEPAPDARHIVVYGLLDSVSATGAYEFRIQPGETTVMETRCRLFPRVEIAQVGIAPLTSMYFFGPERRAGVDDFRDAVHDSSGLQMITGQGLRLWRPLSNPARVQVSAFADDNPKGFGLTQRPRNFDYYQDAEARYDLRPSAWVEPLGGWGPGAVLLVEIPVGNEFNDNIVAFWRPNAPLHPTPEGHAFAYRLHWCAVPPDAAPLARVIATRTGESIHSDTQRVIVVDFRRPAEITGAVEANLTAGGGRVRSVTVNALPGGDVLRTSVIFDPRDAESIEFQLTLEQAGVPVSEKWLYRWTAR